MILYWIHLTSNLRPQTDIKKVDINYYYYKINCIHFFTPVLTLSDFISLTDVEHHFVDLIKWEDENGVKRELRVYSKIAHKWRQIATRLGFELGEIESVEENCHRNDSCITAMFRRWFENVRSLPNAGSYPKSWQGLINLLEDAELGEVAEELRKALSSPQSSVRSRENLS